MLQSSAAVSAEQVTGSCSSDGPLIVAILLGYLKMLCSPNDWVAIRCNSVSLYITLSYFHSVSTKQADSESFEMKAQLRWMTIVYIAMRSLLAACPLPWIVIRI